LRNSEYAWEKKICIVLNISADNKTIISEISERYKDFLSPKIKLAAKVIHASKNMMRLFDFFVEILLNSYQFAGYLTIKKSR